MLDAIDQSQECLDGRDFGAYRSAPIVRLACERCVEVVSEASRHVPPALQDRHPSVRWAEIRAIGNVIRHRYYDLDDLVIWRAVRRDLPNLRPVVVNLIEVIKSNTP